MSVEKGTPMHILGQSEEFSILQIERSELFHDITNREHRLARYLVISSHFW